MKNTIIQKCKEIEKENNVKILLCVESGSRVWGMSSKDSDYDVRFVFVRNIDDYITINKSSEVITAHYDKQGIKQNAEGCILDFCGFDIFKFMKMVSSSNPTVIEWLNSDIIYIEKEKDNINLIRLWIINNINKKSLYYHYKSMCRQNYLKYLKSGNLVTYKKYLYAMRGLVNSMYVQKKGKIPPINFVNTLVNSFNIIPEWLIDRLSEIILKKREGKEKDIIQNMVKIDNYIESFLKNETEIPEKSYATNTELDYILNIIVKSSPKETEPWAEK